MLVSGLHIGWNIFNDNIRAEKWASDTPDFLIMLTLISFYIGAIMGAVIAAAWTQNGNKSKIYKVTGLLHALSCTLIILWPFHWYMVLTSKFIGGLAHTLNYINLVIHCGEVVVKKIRGMVVASIHFCTAVSIFTAIVLVHALKSNPDAIEPARMIGVLGAVYCIMSLSLIPVFFRDSPVLLVKKGRYDEALELMCKLRSEKFANDEIRRDYEEINNMVAEDNKLNGWIFKEENTRPLLLVTLSTTMYVISFNFPLNYIRLTMTNLEYLKIFDLSSILILMVRMIVGIIITAMFDRFRRKSIQSASAFLSGVLLLIIGVSYVGTSKLELSPYVWLTFFLVYETVGSIGMGAVQIVYASEAFPTTKKSSSLAFINIVESMLHTVLIASTFFVNRRTNMFIYIFLFGCSVLMIFISAYLYHELPETRMLSLRRARNKFRGTREWRKRRYSMRSTQSGTTIYSYN